MPNTNDDAHNLGIISRTQWCPRSAFRRDSELLWMRCRRGHVKLLGSALDVQRPSYGGISRTELR